MGSHLLCFDWITAVPSGRTSKGAYRDQVIPNFIKCLLGPEAGNAPKFILKACSWVVQNSWVGGWGGGNHFLGKLKLLALDPPDVLHDHCVNSETTR